MSEEDIDKITFDRSFPTYEERVFKNVLDLVGRDKILPRTKEASKYMEMQVSFPNDIADKRIVSAEEPFLKSVINAFETFLKTALPLIENDYDFYCPETWFNPTTEVVTIKMGMEKIEEEQEEE